MLSYLSFLDCSFSRRSSFVGFQLCSECPPGNKVKTSLNIVADNSSMYINVGNVDGFVKVYSGPYGVYIWGGDSLSSLVVIVYFPKGISILDD